MISEAEGSGQDRSNREYEKNKKQSSELKLGIPQGIHHQEDLEVAEGVHGAGTKQLGSGSSSQIKKPPQVPSLKILQAQRQLPQGGQPLSEGATGGASAGVSAISTIGGVTGNQMEANTAGDYHSSNPFKNNGRKDQGLFRKNSSMSTANQH